MNVIKVLYQIDTDDESLDNEDYKTFIITDDMIINILNEEIHLEKNQSISDDILIYKI